MVKDIEEEKSSIHLGILHLFTMPLESTQGDSKLSNVRVDQIKVNKHLTTAHT